MRGSHGPSCYRRFSESNSADRCNHPVMVFGVVSANQTGALSVFHPLATANLVIADNDESFALAEGTREDVFLVHQDMILADAAN